MGEDERKANQIEDLPSTLHNALKELRNDQVMKDALGTHLYKNFMTAKGIEWDAYREQVFEWERDHYMEMY